MILMGAAGFPLTVRTHTSGTSVTETVPSGATLVFIEAEGGGGAGGRDSFDIGGGGGGGAYCAKTIAVAGGETMTYTVAAVSNGRATNGTGAGNIFSEILGTVTGGAVAVVANGGLGGQTAGNGGNGGQAIGGDTNTDGTAGADNGGAGASPLGGAGGMSSGAVAGAGEAPGGGGGGTSSVVSGAGARGVVIFTYT